MTMTKYRIIHPNGEEFSGHVYDDCDKALEDCVKNATEEDPLAVEALEFEYMDSEMIWNTPGFITAQDKARIENEERINSWEPNPSDLGRT